MRLIYGRAGTGKTYHAMCEIKKWVEEEYEKPLIYIVPEQFSLEAEKELIQVLGKPGIMRAEVLTFKRLAHRVFNEQSFRKTPISASGKSMLIYSILEKKKEQLKLLTNPAKNPGIVDMVMDFISELKRYQIPCEQLKKVTISNEYLKLKLEDIAIIYEEFEKRVEQNYLDLDDELTILAELLKQSHLLDGAKIWLDEFSGFTPQEFKVIERLAKKAEVTVNLTLDEKNLDLFILNQKTKERLEKIEPLEEINLKVYHRYQNKELVHLEQNIFQFPYQKWEQETKNIKLNYCSNLYTEVEKVAIQIIDLVRNQNLRFENIAILARNLEDYQNLFRMIFRLYEIPYFFDDKRELDSQPLIHLVLSLLDICMDSFSYESVFNYLKTGMTNVQDENEIDWIENYVLKYGIRGNTWLKTWDFGETEEKEKVNSIRERVVFPIVEFKNQLKGKKTTRDLAEALYQFLANLGIQEKLQNRVRELKSMEKIEPDKMEVANEYTQVWNIFLKILDEIVEVIGNETISFERFKNTLKMGITQYKIGLIPPSKDKVTIGNIERTRNGNIKALFVIGANDGVFPKSFDTEGFINDVERILLKENGIEVAKDTKTKLFEENFNIYKAFTTASQQLMISFPVSDLEGKNLRPSAVISQIKRIFPKLQEGSNLLEEESDLEYIVTQKSTYTHLLTNLRNYMDGKEMPPIWKEVYHWYAIHESEKLDRACQGLFYRNTLPYVSQQKIRSLYGSTLNASVSKLEKFMNCPFSFYLKYGLKANEREIYKLATPDVGTFLHGIIEKFSQLMLDYHIKWQEIERNWCDQQVERLVEQTLESFKGNLFNRTSRLKSLSIKLKRILKRVIWLIVLQIKNSDFEVLGSEVEFGKGKEYEQLQIDLEQGNQIILSGKIDRIDIAKTEEGKFIRIIDYKSSSKQIQLANVYYGVQLQLLTYLDAVTEKEWIPGGVLYLRLDDPFIHSNRDMTPEEVEVEIMKQLRMKGLLLANVRLVKAMDKKIEKESNMVQMALKSDGTIGKTPLATQEQFQDLRKHIHRILKAIGNEIMKGNVKNEPIKQKKKTACDYCEYKSVCQFDRNLGNEYRYLKEIADEVVYEKIAKENET